MEEVFFKDEWHWRNSEALDRAKYRFTDMMAFVPPSLFGDLNQICNNPDVCCGFFPKGFGTKDCIIKWSLNANILAPGFSRLANIALLTEDERGALYINTQISFMVSFGIRLDYSRFSQPHAEVLTSFDANYINGLRERTFLYDRALHTVLDDAFKALPDFNCVIADKIRNMLPDCNARFIFDKAIRTAIDFRAAHDNHQRVRDLKKDEERKSEELYRLALDASKCLSATAKRIENTKSFTKSRVLEKIRKDAESMADDVDAKAVEIYSGEYNGTIG